MKTLAEYLDLAAQTHGHICAGQVLGVRLAMLGIRELGIEDPVAERKRLVTFVDLRTGRAVRIAAKESSKQAAREMFPELEKETGQQKAYAQLPDEVLFDRKWVKVEVPAEDLPGFKGPRVVCTECGEGINFKREVVMNGRTLCGSCAGEKYYETAP